MDADIQKYVAEELGKLLYDVLKYTLEADYIFKELNRYIPETKGVHRTTRSIFAEYFYDAVSGTEPGNIPNFDARMKRVMTLGYFEKIIGRHLKERTGNFVKCID